MFHIGFIFAFGLKHKLLEDGVITRYDANLEFLCTAMVSIGFLAAGDSKPVPVVKDRMSRIYEMRG